MLLNVLSKNKITSRYTDLLAALCPGNHLNANSPTARFGGVISKRTWPHRDNNKGLATCKVPNFSSSQVKGRPRDPLLCTAGPCVRAKGHLPKAPRHGRAKGPLLHNQVPSEVTTNVSSCLCDGLPVTVVGTDMAEV